MRVAVFFGIAMMLCSVLTIPASAQIREDDPYPWRILFQRGINLYRAGHQDQGLKDIDSALYLIRRDETTTPEAVCEVLYDAANRRWERKEYTLAEPLLQEAVMRLPQIGRTLRDELEIKIRRTLGGTLERLARWNDAEEQYSVLVPIVTGKGAQVDEAGFCSQYANLCMQLGRYEDAIRHYSRACELRRSRQDEWYLRTWTSLALAQMRAGRSSEAEHSFRGALSLGRQLGSKAPETLCRLLNIRAAYLLDDGRLVEADSLCTEALDMSERLSNGDHVIKANAYAQYGNLLTLYGRYSEAEKWNRRSLEMYKRMNNDKGDIVAIMYNNLAGAYRTSGRYSEAVELHKSSADVWRRLNVGDHIDRALGLAGWARTDVLLNRLEDAEHEYREALAMFDRMYPQGHRKMMPVFEGLAGICLELGKTAEAQTVIERALAVPDSILPMRHVNRMGVYAMAGRLECSLGHFDKAVEYLHLCIDVERAAFGAGSSQVLNDQLALAKCAWQQGRIGEADMLYQTVREGYARLYSSGNSQRASALLTMAEYYAATDRPRQAADTWDEGLRMLHHFVELNGAGLNESEHERLRGVLDEDLRKYYAFCIRMLPTEASIASRMFDIRLLTRGVLFKATRRTRDIVANSRDTAIQRLYALWISYRERQIRAYEMNPEERRLAGYDPVALGTKASEFERELRRRAIPFADVDTSAIDWRKLRSILHSGEAAVDIIRVLRNGAGADSVLYAAIVLRYDGEPRCITLNDGAGLDTRDLYTYRRRIQRRETDDLSWSRFWKPVDDVLSGIGTVYLATDGVYNQVNLSTLQCPDSTYLIDKLNIVLVSSLDELHFDHESQRMEKGLAVLYGNPVVKLSDADLARIRRQFDLRRQQADNAQATDSTDTPTLVRLDLPGAEQEVKDVTVMLRRSGWQVTTRVGREAAESSLKSIRHPAVLHIATHGFVLTPNETRSKSPDDLIFGMSADAIRSNPLLQAGLLLAETPASSDSAAGFHNADNGVLTAWEASNLDLQGTELVVVSSCGSGLGRTLDGEGVYGLQRAFLSAGARNILISLWGVSDDAATELITSFYQGILSDLPFRRALLEAQKQLRKTRPDPVDWGAFVLVNAEGCSR